MSFAADSSFGIASPLAAVMAEYHRLIDEEKRGLIPRADRAHRFMAVGPETGQMLNIFARSLAAPRVLELGTSYGYSTLWLADGARAAGGRVTTLELHADKADFARAMARKAGLDEIIDFRVGDALALLPQLPGPFDLVLVDHWKALYRPSFVLFRDRLAPGAILVADNMVQGGSTEGQDDYAQAVRSMPGMSSVLLPVGSGIEVSRYLPEGV